MKLGESDARTCPLLHSFDKRDEFVVFRVDVDQICDISQFTRWAYLKHTFAHLVSGARLVEQKVESVVHRWALRLMLDTVSICIHTKNASLASIFESFVS